MGRIHDDRGRLLRGRWLVLGTDDEQEVGYAHATDLPVQVAMHGTIGPLALVDACWYRDGRLLQATSLAIPAGAPGSPELGLAGGPFAARAHGRPIPPPRLTLRVPATARRSADLPRPSQLALPEPAFDVLPTGRPFSWAAADNVHLHGWHSLDDAAVPALVHLRTLSVPVVAGREVLPALVCDVALLGPRGRLLLPLRVVVPGPNRSVRTELVRLVDQALALVGRPPAAAAAPAGAIA